MAVFVAIDLLFISRDRAVVLAQLAALATLLEWTADRGQPRTFDYHNPMPGIWTKSDKVVLALAIVLGLVDRRSCRDIPRRRHRALSEPGAAGRFGCVRWQELAIVALPAFPTFIGRDYRSVVYNIWEWGYAKLSKPRADDTSPIDVAAVELSQPHLVEAEIKKLLPGAQGHDGHLCHWHCRLVGPGCVYQGIERRFVDPEQGRSSMDRGTMRLVNHRDTLADHAGGHPHELCRGGACRGWDHEQGRRCPGGLHHVARWADGRRTRTLGTHMRRC